MPSRFTSPGQPRVVIGIPTATGGFRAFGQPKAVIVTPPSPPPPPQKIAVTYRSQTANLVPGENLIPHDLGEGVLVQLLQNETVVSSNFHIKVKLTEISITSHIAIAVELQLVAVRLSATAGETVAYLSRVVDLVPGENLFSHNLGRRVLVQLLQGQAIVNHNFSIAIRSTEIAIASQMVTTVELRLIAATT